MPSYCTSTTCTPLCHSEKRKALADLLCLLMVSVTGVWRRDLVKWSFESHKIRHEWQIVAFTAYSTFIHSTLQFASHSHIDGSELQREVPTLQGFSLLPIGGSSSRHCCLTYHWQCYWASCRVITWEPPFKGVTVCPSFSQDIYIGRSPYGFLPSVDLRSDVFTKLCSSLWSVYNNMSESQTEARQCETYCKTTITDAHLQPDIQQWLTVRSVCHWPTCSHTVTQQYRLIWSLWVDWNTERELPQVDLFNLL